MSETLSVLLPSAREEREKKKKGRRKENRCSSLISTRPLPLLPLLLIFFFSFNVLHARRGLLERSNRKLRYTNNARNSTREQTRQRFLDRSSYRCSKVRSSSPGICETVRLERRENHIHFRYCFYSPNAKLRHRSEILWLGY